MYKFSFDNIRTCYGYNFALQKSKFCRGCTFSNAVKIMIFVSDVQNYIPIKLCKTASSIHLFKITGMLKAENIKLNKNYTWNMLEIDWKEVMVTFNENKINFAKSCYNQLQDKIKVRSLMKRELYFSPNAETRNYMVYFGHRHTRNCINKTAN